MSLLVHLVLHREYVQPCTHFLGSIGPRTGGASVCSPAPCQLRARRKATAVPVARSLMERLSLQMGGAAASLNDNATRSRLQGQS